MREIFSLVGRISTEGFSGVFKNFEHLDKTLTVAANRIDKFGRDVQKIGTNITKLTAPLAAVAGGIGVLALKTGEYADKMLDLKDITGLSTDTLQELENVARAAGVNFDGLTGTISAFQRHLPEIVKGTGASADALKALGVNVFDAQGNVRDMNDLFPEMVNRLQSIENVTERNAIASQLFGKNMKDLAPVLGMGSVAFAKARTEAHAMGMVMSTDALEAANEFKIGVEELKGRFLALARDLASKFIPILQNTILPLIRDQLIPFLKRTADGIGAVATWFNNLNPWVKSAAMYFGLFAVALGPMLIGIGKMISMVKTAIVTLKLLRSVMLMNPIGLWITLIGLAVVAGIALYKNWDTVAEALGKAWDWITYVFQQGIGYIRTAVFAAMSAMLDLAQSVAGWVPGLDTALDGLRARMDALAAAEMGLVYERRRARVEAQGEIEDTEALTATVDAAKAATDQYTTSTLAQVQAGKEDEAQAKKQAKAAEELAQKRDDFETGWTEKLRSEIMTRSQNLEWEYQEALSLAQQYGASRQDIELYYQIKRLELAEEEAKKKADLANQEADKRQQTYQQTYSMAVDAVNQIFSLMSQANAIELEELDQKTEAQLAAVEASTMSEEEKAAAKEAIAKESSAKERALKREQAKRDKAQAIFNAIINGFEAVSKALTLAFPLNIIMAVLMGALAAVQVGLIASQPLPALAKGGVVRSRDGGTQVLAGEGGQDEMILPMDTGVRKVVNKVIEGIRNTTGGGQQLPGSLGGGGEGGLAMAGAGGVHLHVGTLVADDSGMRNLERTLLKFRNQEMQRKGQA